jgi:hypothetical protein
MYLGDALVEAAVHRAYSSDPAMQRRVLKLFAQSQREDGQMPPVTPGWVKSHLTDYTVLWVHLLYDYWMSTADTGTLERFWPTLEQVLYGSFWQEAENGLWELPPDKRAFVDHSANAEQKRGQSGPLNAFRFRALQMASEMALALGRKEQAQRHNAEAEKVRAAYQTLWLEAQGRYAPSRLDGELSAAHATHNNALALLYGLAPEERQARILAYVEERMRINLDTPEGHVELYFLYFVLQALYLHDRADLAETIIRSHYGLMQRRGAWTIWECFARGLEERGSYCHAWSCAPVALFARHTLGVREASPGDLEEILIAPQSASLDWARGSVPHAKGPVIVEWRLEGELLFLSASLPHGTRAKVRPEGRLAAYPLRMQLRERPL